MARILLPFLFCLLAAAPASAAERLTIRGAGFGHGVGMSQYGAYGFALNGSDYGAILRHYYSGTEVGTLGEARTVRVLLSSPGTARFTGAARAGTRRLSPTRTYAARRAAVDRVDLLSSSGRRLATFTAPLEVAGDGGVVTLQGQGRYRGALEFRPGLFGGLNAINAVGLEDYVRGVVARESPSSWPAEALKAQAVAARTYAITTSKDGNGFNHYADTRSQVYGGVAAETASTDAAVAATRGQVVTYDGEPVVTYFFSTSGGRTENVEYSLGGEPKPWLKSVEDPYDDTSPKHRWGPIRMSLRTAQGKLGGLVKGRFRGIKVLRRGVSPRIVAAEVIGTRGRTRVSGATLRARFGLDDTWAFFTSIASRERRPPSGDNRTGGATPSAAPRTVGAITGRVIPGRRGEEVEVQVRRGAEWVTVARAVLDSAGRYSQAVARRGTYRVVHRHEVGPPVVIG